jgi:NAD(P) transhydrogenase subunit alpha
MEGVAKTITTTTTVTETLHAGGVDPFIFGLTVFVLACFVGYYVVWRVTPALHTPLMSVTNAISGIIVVGAIIALGPQGFGVSHTLGFIAVMIASVNIFGGFVVTQRMLAMFKKKTPAPSKGGK